ncbi:MAG TPA: L,D-transpeptidase family protein [Gaiellaceae bacterium]|nr:L,D-transpeptidase family protein [Gaiellaceae bacterium]
MRRAAVVFLALAFVPAARASGPTVSIQASVTSGPAPLSVTLTASGDPASYHWDLGDGTTADGAVVQHVYPAGRFTATVTATGAGGTSQAQVTVTSVGLALGAPKVGSYQQLLRFHGRVIPALKGVRVGLYRGEQRIASAKADRKGRISIRGRVGGPGSQYTLRYAGAVSNAVVPAVQPGLDTAFHGTGQVGRPLALVARERPAGAGPITVQVWRNRHLVGTHTGNGRLRIRLGTARSTTYRIVVSVAPAAGYAANKRVLEEVVFEPNLRVGSGGPSVLALEQRLHELHYALAAVNAYYGTDTSDAVVAFQKLHGLPRTGTTDARFWRELEVAHVPVPRYPGTHVEVSKELQVLLMVRDGQVTLVVPVSTGATGNTPVGLWHVYSKVPGYNAKEMYYSSFFIGGFAIHGYHDVPYYPASHGCVRIPIWVATRVYSLIPYGTAVYVY